jgi:hypothetical protein
MHQPWPGGYYVEQRLFISAVRIETASTFSIVSVPPYSHLGGLPRAPRAPRAPTCRSEQVLAASIKGSTSARAVKHGYKLIHQSVALTLNLLYTACLFSIGLGENVLDGLVDRLDLVSLLVGDLDAELLLDGNNNLDGV